MRSAGALAQYPRRHEITTWNAAAFERHARSPRLSCILEGYELHRMPRAEAEHLHLESSQAGIRGPRRVSADPEFVDAPVQGLLAVQYAAERRKLIDRRHAGEIAHTSWATSCVPARSGACRCAARHSGAVRHVSPASPSHTTHLTVADAAGNVVVYTFTIEDWGGSGIVVPGYGFLLNNEMTDFDFTGPHPNVPEPGKRPRSSMSPTLVLKNGKPAFTIGAPGGSTIITTVLQTDRQHCRPWHGLRRGARGAEAEPAIARRRPSRPGSQAATSRASPSHSGHRWDDAEFGEIGYANALFFDNEGRVNGDQRTEAGRRRERRECSGLCTDGKVATQRTVIAHAAQSRPFADIDSLRQCPR